MITRHPQPKETETAILDEALRAFEKINGIPAIIVEKELRLPQGQADTIIELAKNKRFVVEVKRTLTLATIGQVATQLARFNKPGMLVTRYVTPPMAERLKELGIAFIDTAGNAYVPLPNFFVFVTGRKLETPAVHEQPVRAFRTTGLKVIFALLCCPDMVNAPYREIAKATDVALGAVGWVFKDLKKLGYIYETKLKKRVLEEKERLINAWVDAYTKELRPRLKPRHFKVANEDWWKTEDIKALDMWIGGEPAAAVLTKYLRPEIITIYGDAHFDKLARKIHPVKNEYGNLHLLQKFWNFELPRYDKHYPLVPPLLVYADLVATLDGRNLETAQMIREQFLAKA